MKICYIVSISEKGNAISTLYLFWRKAYQSYITLGNTNNRLQKDMEQLYHSSIPRLIQAEKRYRTVLSQFYIWIYHFCRKLYHSSIPCLIQAKKDIEQSYHCPISGYITFTESSITMLYPACYWHKQILHKMDFLVDGSFCCRRISQTCPFLPQKKLPVKPSAFESEIHPSHKPPVCTLCISPLQGANSRKRELQMLTHLQ